MAMILPSRPFYILCPIFLLLIRATTQPDFQYYFCAKDGGNVTYAYRANLDNLLSSLVIKEDNGFGFYNLSNGNAPDKVYTMGLCRGDVDSKFCRTCLNDCAYLLRQRCSNKAEAVGWYDNCTLRYSNRSMLGIMETSRTYSMWNTRNLTSNVDGFFQNLSTLLNNLKKQAAAGGSLRKFATGNTSAPDFITIYALVQCSPDLSQRDCDDCLDDQFGFIPTCCDGKVGGRVVGPTCNFRYEIYLFFGPAYVPLRESPPLLAPPSINSTTRIRDKENNPSRTVIIAVVSTVVSMILIISACVYLWRKKKKDEEAPQFLYQSAEEIESLESLRYSFEIIRGGTDNFSEANKLGQGGFGSVYRGKLPDGQDIAVKRLSRNSDQGDLEFKNEVLLVAKLQHRNLVRLLGFCLEGSERLLVYEFVPNASLDNFIFDPSKRANLDWERRYKIIGGIARGLLYLHEDSRLRVIHRDLKASNILLDEEMHPKISDFGLASGYMAPVYAMHGHFSVRTDAWRNWIDRTVSNIIDPLVTVNSVSEIMRYIHIGLLCVQENVAHRPTMDTIVLMLNSNSLSLPVPSEPAFFTNSDIGSDMALASANETSISELYPR
ncbi:Cysteine-rich receptor-like protein kinase 29 [Morus notabilis]|uniref:non-specific serine/threonine protein kinase n=1 Tax=Morus notabilis TaxID=981085 RepID=W9QXJ7_9ROSA|nr:Cysteine-rich receptor-like protein kinase 29 [Morus notabilis]